jgi:hypothetical protein
VAWQEDVDKRFQWAIDNLKARGMLQAGDSVIGTQGSGPADTGVDGDGGGTSVIRYFPALK